MDEIICPAPETQAPPEAALTRAELEAAMDALEKSFQSRLDAQHDALAQKEAALRRQELTAKARQALQQRELPIALADALPFADDAALQNGLDALEEAFRAAVQKAVEERLLSAAPKAAPVKPLSEMTDEEYYAAVCP